jgi:hypothetical protein
LVEPSPSVKRNVKTPIGRSERELIRAWSDASKGLAGAVDRIIERHLPPFGRNASELGIGSRGPERRGLIFRDFTGE